MAHSKIKIWIHAIIGVKNTSSYIKAENENLIYDKIKQQFIAKKCYVEAINGVNDHIHVLFLLHPDLTIREIMKYVKGGSAYQINRSFNIGQKIYWQTGFGCFSISESHIEKVKSYINNQKEHHKKMTFQQEFDLFLKKYGIKNG